MSKSTKISLLFFIIFLAGVLGIFSFVNESLNKKSTTHFHVSGTSVVVLSSEN
ncbi:hypothetical protein LZ575_15015 [Antarcticibacterium sp. 1MA-6-2]|uniref:hypothetical protein n=1 Tax=Antarcticibacterium sp. 1MA-6-2 TaxID=2908210 RepID=UPI001F41609B|nr:hypothetical protein [Antarcticibacterium sp. 1MA-6-2]UJH90200.1 hypothetical protein LZ575_15015 [Antarcticibacterium sp. 1MA-6-2]